MVRFFETWNSCKTTTSATYKDFIDAVTFDREYTGHGHCMLHLSLPMTNYQIAKEFIGPALATLAGQDLEDMDDIFVFATVFFNNHKGMFFIELTIAYGANCGLLQEVKEKLFFLIGTLRQYDIYNDK